MVFRYCGASMESDCRARTHRQFAWMLLVLGLWPALGVPQAQGQSTDANADIVRQLLEPIVTDLGPKYQAVQDAVVRFRNRDVDGAHELLKQAHQAQPELPPGDIMLATLLLSANQVGAARTALEDAVKDHPEDPDAYLALGELALRERQIAEAALLYEKANQLTKDYGKNPKRKDHMMSRSEGGLAAVAEARLDWKKAAELLQSVKQRLPDDASIHQRLARAIYKSGDASAEKKAYDIYNEIYNKDKKLPRPELQMAGLFQMDGKTANVDKLVARAVERDGNGLNTRIAAAQWALESDDVKKAKEHATKAVAIDPKSLAAQALLGTVARYEKDYAAASQTLSTAHLMAPANFVVTNSLALALAEHPDEAQKRLAIEYSQLSLRAFSDLNSLEGRTALITASWTFFLAGRRTESEQLLQRYAQSGGGLNPESAYHAAKMLFERGNAEGALAVLKPALANSQPFPDRQAARELLSQLESAPSTPAK